MLTTIDNPYSPFEEWDRWLRFDIEKGYDTCGLLARIAKTSDEFSDEEKKSAINDAIDECIAEDITNMYIKIAK
ncbi:MAG: hypothetical protein SPI49_03400 [Eubacteriales bacterium]|nr:hypothetical protein [Eubacteriales bacterium]